jgi:hypothetical protein
MNEAQWPACHDPFAMFTHLGESVGWRKRQLYCLAVWGSVRHLLDADEYTRKGLAFLEANAETFDWWDERDARHERAYDALTDIDGELTNCYWDRIEGGDAELYDAFHAGLDWQLTTWDDPGCVEDGAEFVVSSQALYSGWVPSLDGSNIHTTAPELAERIEGYARTAGAKPLGVWQERQRLHAELVREVFGNPFRKAKIKWAWLACNDGIVAKLAQAIEEERAFDRLPILADALEDAGCTDADLLDHLRSPGSHVRGCWALDLILGKQ